MGVLVGGGGSGRTVLGNWAATSRQIRFGKRATAESGRFWEYAGLKMLVGGLSNVQGYLEIRVAGPTARGEGGRTHLSPSSSSSFLEI